MYTLTGSFKRSLQMFVLVSLHSVWVYVHVPLYKSGTLSVLDCLPSLITSLALPRLPLAPCKGPPRGPCVVSEYHCAQLSLASTPQALSHSINTLQ